MCTYWYMCFKHLQTWNCIRQLGHILWASPWAQRPPEKASMSITVFNEPPPCFTALSHILFAKSPHFQGQIYFLSGILRDGSHENSALRYKKNA